jgi:hypothetical protein
VQTVRGRSTSTADLSDDIHLSGSGRVEDHPFEQAAEVLRSLLPAELAEVRIRARRYGIKVWYGTSDPAKEHYEAQVVGSRYVPDATVLALEIGFHSEHPKPEDNERALDRLLRAERRWRKTLGPDPVAGAFLGRDSWRRLSETWVDPDLSDPELPVEIGTRLYEYVAALEPLRVTS